MEGLINRQIAIFRVIGGDVVTTTRKRLSSSRCVPSSFLSFFLPFFLPPRPRFRPRLLSARGIRRKRAAEKRQGSRAKEEDRSFRRNVAIDPSNGRHPLDHKIFTDFITETLTHNEVTNYHRINSRDTK